MFVVPDCVYDDLVSKFYLRFLKSKEFNSLGDDRQKGAEAGCYFQLILSLDKIHEETRAPAITKAFNFFSFPTWSVLRRGRPRQCPPFEEKLAR